MDRDVKYEWEDDPNHGDGSGAYGLPCATLTLLIAGISAVLYAAWLVLGGK